MKKEYLVTGAAGFLGTNIVRQLCTRGESVRALVLPNDPTAKHLPQQVRRVTGDTTDLSSLKAFFEGGQTEKIVVHAAGIVSISGGVDRRMWNVNVGGTKNIIESCVRCGVRRLVYVSSVHAIEPLAKGVVMREPERFDPERVVGDYAKTKAEATREVLRASRGGLDVVVVFPSGLCGPGDFAGGHVTQLLVDAARGKMPAGVEGGYNFADVRDVAAGVIAAAQLGRAGQGYILANRSITIMEILRMVHEQTGAPLVRHVVCGAAARAMLPFFGLYYKLAKRPPLFTKYSLYTILSNSEFSIEKAQKELGYCTRPFEQTVHDSLLWLQKQKRIPQFC